MEEINIGKYKPQEVMHIAESLGLNNSDYSDVIRAKKHKLDSSLDDFSGLTGTDSSSFVSDQSSS